MDDIRFGKVTLAKPGDHVIGYRERGAEEKTPRRPMRGQTGGVYRRGGATTTITLTVRRSHDTNVDARAFIRTHRREIFQEEATEVILTVSGRGASESALEHAAVTVTDSWTKGQLSFVQYEIEGAEKLS